MEERVAALERRFELLKSPVVAGKEVLPPVGVIADFCGEITDPAIAERARRDSLPIPSVVNRENYAADSHARYWMTGLQDYDNVKRRLDEFSVHGGRLYDFGGATGRVFRHFFCQDGAFEIWSSDFQTSNYYWNQRFMPAELRLFLNGFYPCLPIPDGYFDALTAFSVFTHIDELESAWLLELRRVLKPRGLLYATIHDEAYWLQMSDAVVSAIRRSPNGADVTADSPFPIERTAYHFSEDTYYSCNVFHPHDYIRREWGRFFDILEITPKGHFGQCVVALTYE